MREGWREGTRAKPGNRLVYYIKLQCPFVCLSVPPFFRHDRRTATKFGTHNRIEAVQILPSSPAFWWRAVHCGICILENACIIVHNTLCCCHKYRVLSNLILFH